MAGFGYQSAGTTSGGFGTPPTADPEGGALFRDEKTGKSFGGRKIDPRTGDYEMDANGRLLGMDNVQQLVQLAVMDAQDDLRAIDRLNDGFERAASAALKKWMAPLVQQGIIEIIGVRKATDVRLGVLGGLKQGQALYRFAYRDLTSSLEHEEPI